MDSPKQPPGPNVRKLTETMEQIAEKIDPEKSAAKLEHLGRSLVEAADKLRRGEMSAFNDLGVDDVETLFKLVLSYGISSELVSAARELDAEGN